MSEPYNFQQGYVLLKRKTSWVRRFATVHNSVFTYRNSHADARPKATINLQTAKIMEGRLKGTQKYIYIQQDPFKAEAIRITFQTMEEYSQWLESVQLGRL